MQTQVRIAQPRPSTAQTKAKAAARESGGAAAALLARTHSAAGRAEMEAFAKCVLMEMEAIDDGNLALSTMPPAAAAAALLHSLANAPRNAVAQARRFSPQKYGAAPPPQGPVMPPRTSSFVHLSAKGSSSQPTLTHPELQRSLSGSDLTRRRIERAISAYALRRAYVEERVTPLYNFKALAKPPAAPRCDPPQYALMEEAYGAARVRQRNRAPTDAKRERFMVEDPFPPPLEGDSAEWEYGQEQHQHYQAQQYQQQYQQHYPQQPQQLQKQQQRQQEQQQQQQRAVRSSSVQRHDERSPRRSTQSVAISGNQWQSVELSPQRSPRPTITPPRPRSSGPSSVVSASLQNLQLWPPAPAPLPVHPKTGLDRFGTGSPARASSNELPVMASRPGTASRPPSRGGGFSLSGPPSRRPHTAEAAPLSVEGCYSEPSSRPPSAAPGTAAHVAQHDWPAAAPSRPASANVGEADLSHPRMSAAVSASTAVEELDALASSRPAVEAAPAASSGLSQSRPSSSGLRPVRINRRWVHTAPSRPVRRSTIQTGADSPWMPFLAPMRSKQSADDPAVDPRLLTSASVVSIDTGIEPALNSSSVGNALKATHQMHHQAVPVPGGWSID